MRRLAISLSIFQTFSMTSASHACGHQDNGSNASYPARHLEYVSDIGLGSVEITGRHRSLRDKRELLGTCRRDKMWSTGLGPLSHGNGERRDWFASQLARSGRVDVWMCGHRRDAHRGNGCRSAGYRRCRIAWPLQAMPHSSSVPEVAPDLIETLLAFVVVLLLLSPPSVQSSNSNQLTRGNLNALPQRFRFLCSERQTVDVTRIRLPGWVRNCGFAIRIPPCTLWTNESGGSQTDPPSN